eukprot:GHVU01098643.1.p3 GENE.GHVU01098643.1~~GHVU01098643.1.p3  ORF type:complete len:119 (-),score=5.81 GHVU01098643.1:1432-1788(-)
MMNRPSSKRIVNPITRVDSTRFYADPRCTRCDYPDLSVSRSGRRKLTSGLQRSGTSSYRWTSIPGKPGMSLATGRTYGGPASRGISVTQTEAPENTPYHRLKAAAAPYGLQDSIQVQQ